MLKLTLTLRSRGCRSLTLAAVTSQDSAAGAPACEAMGLHAQHGKGCGCPCCVRLAGMPEGLLGPKVLVQGAFHGICHTPSTGMSQPIMLVQALHGWGHA